MNRRDVLKSALAGAGAVTAGAAQQHSAHQPTAPGPKQPAAAWKPLLFDEHQAATVAALVDVIIPKTDTPGAREARVHEHIDLVLHDGAAQRRNRFLHGLAWLDGYTIRQHGKPFVRASAEEQTAVLKSLDRAQAPELKPGAAFFAEIKRLTVSGYYTTRAGIAELNKGGRVPASFACKGNDH